MSILTVMHLKPFKSRFPTFFFVSREIKVVNEFFIFTQKKSPEMDEEKSDSTEYLLFKFYA